MIPEKAIQAAHAAICEQNIDDCLDPDWRGKCVKAVEAAAPYMRSISAEDIAAVGDMIKAAKADGWDEGCKKGLATNPGWEDEALAANPYKPGQRPRGRSVRNGKMGGGNE